MSKGLNDRGKMKWQAALIMPEHKKLINEMLRDDQRQPKRIADEYELAEFDEKLHYAIAYNLPVRLTVWDDGFTEDLRGHIHYIDEITKEVRLKVANGTVERLRFEALVGVEVIE
ncbi:YolD-like family protein [Peribacillus frigoritolerans]|uniref:YolD-like family protein n=1 Tax=Peribacillus frigoritolerans TaxID=450367 RepID=UPI0037F8DDE9